MVKRMFAIYDVKTASYGDPFFATMDGEAIRMVTDVVADERSMFCKHPSDFKLFYIGEWRPLEGIITPITPPMFLVELESLVRK